MGALWGYFASHNYETIEDYKISNLFPQFQNKLKNNFTQTHNYALFLQPLFLLEVFLYSSIVLFEFSFVIKVLKTGTKQSSNC